MLPIAMIYTYINHLPIYPSHYYYVLLLYLHKDISFMFAGGIKYILFFYLFAIKIKCIPIHHFSSFYFIL